MYVIYLDVLFIINWCMNVLIFYCITLILNKRIRFLRLIGGGAIGALAYCMLVLVPLLQEIPYWVYTLVVPVLPILYLYKPKTFKAFVKVYLLCTLVAAVFGGVIFNVWFMVKHDLQGIDTIGFGILLLIGGGITGIFYTSFYWIRRRIIFPGFEYELVLKNQDKRIAVRALLDSGNLLYTPIRHEPVIVAEYKIIKSLLSKEQQEAYEQYRKCSSKEIEDALVSGKCKPEVLVPFNSVGCAAGYLWGIRIEEVRVRKQAGERAFFRCVIGISSETLFSDQQYHALLHPEFILEEVMAS